LRIAHTAHEELSAHVLANPTLPTAWVATSWNQQGLQEAVVAKEPKNAPSLASYCPGI